MRIAALVLTPFVVLALAATAGARSITGTPGNDRLVGSTRADTLRGQAGRDVLLGRGGGDYLDGGPGRDRFDGGPGADRVVAAYDGGRDTVRCGSGPDVVNADLGDDVARDCELIGRRLSRDPYRSDGAQHETEVEPSGFTFGRTTVAAFQVGRFEAGAATNIGFAVTNDDGTTWRSGFLPGLTAASVPAGVNERASDPVVAYDARHDSWLISTLALGGGATRLAINRSPDGLTWSTALTAAEETAVGGDEGIAFDKNWVACDNTATSPFYGRCYLVYTHSGNRDMLAVRWSDDGGVSWSTGVDVGARPAVGVIPVIRPTGELVVAYLWELGRFAIAASTSRDGGVSWSAPVRVAGVAGSCGIPGFRAFALPSADADASGRIWVAWHDCASATATQSSVFAASSADGTTWSPPTRVTSGRSTVLPAIALDPATGRMAIAFFRDAVDGVHTELVESNAGGAFGAPRRLSAEGSAFTSMARTTSGRMLGDYFSVHYARGRPLAVWVLALPPVNGIFREAVYATRG
jgi:hemolysin type calcium-binding protein/BNR repeat protein